MGRITCTGNQNRTVNWSTATYTHRCRNQLFGPWYALARSYNIQSTILNASCRTRYCNPLELHLFHVFASELSYNPHRLLKYMVLARSTASLRLIFITEFEENSNSVIQYDPDDTIAVLHHKPADPRGPQIDWHEETHSLDSMQIKNRCWQHLNVSEVYSTFHQDSLQMMEPLAVKRNQIFGGIIAAKNRIYLTPGSSTT